MWRVDENILNKQSRAGDKGLFSNVGVERGANISSSPKLSLVTKWIHFSRTWIDPVVQRKQWKRAKRFGTWNVRSLYGVRFTYSSNQGISTYKLEVVGVQEFRWDKGGTVRAKDCICFFGKGNENHQLETGFFVHHRKVLADKRVECVTKDQQNAPSLMF